MKRTQKKRTRMIAFLLILAMFFTSCEWPMRVQAADVEQTEEATEIETVEPETEEQENTETVTEEDAITEETPDINEMEDAELVGELTELRNEFSKQFLMEDNSIMAVQYDADVHYQDEEGQWKEIDNSLEEEDAKDSGDASGYSNKAGKIKYKFAKNANANFLVRIMQGPHHIFFSAKGTKKQAEGAKVMEAEPAENTDGSLPRQLEVSNNRSGVVYKDLFEGTDVEYLLSGSSMKENIIVKEKQDAYEYEFEIRTNKVTIQEDEDGIIRFYKEGTEELLYTIPKMYMWDANGQESDAIEVTLKTKNKKSTLTVRADETWINSEDRAFPVTIDPTLQSTSTSVGAESRIVRNQYVSKGNPTVSSAGYGRGFLGYDTSSDKTYRLFVQFVKLPSIPENSVIIGSKFYYGQIAYDHVGLSKLTVAAREVTQNWTWGTKINWNTQPSYDTGTVWSAVEK